MKSNVTKRAILTGLFGLWASVANADFSGPSSSSMWNPSTIYSGQQAATGSAAALPSYALSNGIVITAKSANSGTIYVGPSGVTISTGYPLAAGQSISYAVTNLSAISILGSASGDGVAFTGN